VLIFQIYSTFLVKIKALRGRKSPVSGILVLHFRHAWLMPQGAARADCSNAVNIPKSGAGGN
jgi:hypothetical protein